MSKFGWLLLGGLSCVACAGGASGGGGQLGKPIAQFPSRGELDRVAREPTPLTKPPEGLADAERWQTESLPPAQPQYPEETTWDKLMVEAVRGHGHTVSLAPELRCAAQEAARFYTVHGGMPDEGVREHLLLRCG